jgi:hypothetical protein
MPCCRRNCTPNADSARRVNGWLREYACVQSAQFGVSSRLCQQLLDFSRLEGCENSWSAVSGSGGFAGTEAGAAADHSVSSGLRARAENRRAWKFTAVSDLPGDLPGFRR